MLVNVRAARARAARPVLSNHRRLLATPPPNYPVPTSPVAPPASQPAPIAPTPTTTLPPPSSAGALPPPPPPRGRRPFRRFLLYTALGALTFYPLSGWLSTQYEGYRDFFTGTFPLGEVVADYADDHHWETFGVGTVSKKAAQALQRAKGDAAAVAPGSTKEEAANRFRELQTKAESGAKKAENEVRSTLGDLEARAKAAANSVATRAAEAKDAVVRKAKEETLSLRDGAADVVDKVKKQSVSLREDASDVADKAKKQAVSLREDAADSAEQATKEAKKEAVSLREDASDVADKAKREAKNAAVSLRDDASDAADQVKKKALSLREDAADVASGVKKEAVSLRERAGDAAESIKAKAVDAASAAKAKAEETASAVKTNVVSAEKKVERGAKDVVREAEDALRAGEKKVEDAAHTVKAKLDETPGPQGYLDAQRPRELRPETVTPAKPTYEGQTLYKGPALPVGHEPPPGYYIPQPAAPKVPEPAEKVQETLPLLAPKVKEFATEEPIVTQLASTIDSLTSSLSTPNSGDSTKILSKAQDDLNALTQRLSDVKKAEKAKLEKTVGEKVKEFEQVLRAKEQERAQGEEGLKQNWEKEKSKLVEDWHKELESELEAQRQGIEQRLREEVVSQGIELQRRWLRSIKSQVETERGGRLAKLDSLTTSLKQLERITLDNSASLDDNVRLHKVWSALRAVQAKAEAGDASFDDELRLLRSLSTPSADAPESVVSVTLAQLDKSGIARTGVKSFASLASWFSNSVSPRVHSAALVPAPEEASVLSHVASAVFSKVMFAPKAGLAEGDDVSSTLARAELCLGEKDLDGAAREVNSLKGWPAKLAEDWLREARRRLEVEQALEIVGAEATLGSLLLV